jgi:alanyl-tRNA synthetase
MHYTTSSLREKWFQFWESKGHKIIPSASVLPDNDPTALFHNSGMHPLVPFLLGQKHPQGVRLANAQKCIRTGDIDEVGDATHLTFFEMLGNWSLGDYFKKEQIEWSFEFLTQVLELPIEKLAFSVFEGNQNAPRDEDAAQYWLDQGVSPERIAYLGVKDNWWAKGDVGPCGPDSEMFYWTGDEPAPENFQETHDDPRWVEIWNDVFMQFDRNSAGILTPLSQKNIDTGMGLERTVMVLNGFTSVYQIDNFIPLINKIAALANKPELAQNPIADTEEARSMRIITDHIRSATVLMSDRIMPSNIDQGYILRRLIRRAVRHARKIGINDNFCIEIATVVIDTLEEAYPELNVHKQTIFHELEREENQFRHTLEKGEKEFEKLFAKSNGHLDGKTAFYIYETYGFPFEMTEELAAEHGLSIKKEEFDEAMKAHQEKSKSGSEQKFSGGLGDKSEETVKLHTATHLMHAALKKVLGDHVEQRGSNITPERLRFDFSHPEKVTPEQIAEVEKIVNEAIQSDAKVECMETTVEDAKEQNAIGLFEHKYGDKVKMYTMGEHSKEICGGPHVEHLGVLGTFKIKKEEASSRGVRRIKAILKE